MESQKFLKHKVSTNTLIKIIPFIVILLIIISDIIFYRVDVMLMPYVTIFYSLIIAFLKNNNRRTLIISYIFVAISLITFLYLKPNYTINQAKQKLKQNNFKNVEIAQLGYIKRKNIFLRGAYVFRTENRKLIIFNNSNGEFYIVKDWDLSELIKYIIYEIYQTQHSVWIHWESDNDLSITYFYILKYFFNTYPCSSFYPVLASIPF